MFARNRKRNRGQALVEYSVLFAFVVIVLKATMVVITPRLGETYCTFMSEVSGTPGSDCGVAEEPIDIDRMVKDVDDIPDNGPFCVPLVLEGEGTVGDVVVVNNGDTISVAYTINDGWCLDSTHLHVGFGAIPELEDYTYEHPNLDCATSDFFEVDGTAGADLTVALAAGVHQDARADNNALTSYHGRVTENVAHPGGDSYFNTTVSGDITGTFDGFCIDTTRGISTGPTYNSEVWSSYDPSFPDGVIGYKENLDLVNYIINQDYTAHGYTMGDVQRAIWTVIGPKVSTSGIGSYSQSRVDRIVDEATTNGDGFVPDCEGGVVALILQPLKSNGKTAAQVTIIETPMAAIGACTPVSTDQTAFAPTDFVDLVCEVPAS
jgi:Flp pilus assembly pilin Flp